MMCIDGETNTPVLLKLKNEKQLRFCFESRVILPEEKHVARMSIDDADVVVQQISLAEVKSPSISAIFENP